MSNPAKFNALAREFTDQLPRWVTKDLDGDDNPIEYVSVKLSDVAAALDQYGDALARAIREEDAKVAEKFAAEWLVSPASMEGEAAAAEQIATAIRALRGATPEGE